MTSLPKGLLRVLTWFDSTADELKALINDDGRLPVSIDEQNVNLDTQSLVYDGSSWVKSPIPWGYTDTWAEQVYVENAGTGTNVLSSLPVPEGYVYVLSGMNTLNVNTACTQWHYMILNTITCRLGTYAAIGAGVTQPTFPIEAQLKEGDYACGRFLACTLNDDLYARFWGYKMKVDM